MSAGERINAIGLERIAIGEKTNIYGLYSLEASSLLFLKPKSLFLMITKSYCYDFVAIVYTWRFFLI